MLSGGDVSWLSFFKNNLLPVTLGNIVGGAGARRAILNLLCDYAYPC
jgi:formate/nitrite transporter FocA (FNT family)